MKAEAEARLRVKRGSALDWRKIPENVEYFLGEDDTEYFICERGWVLEGRHFEEGEPNLEKVIMPTVQGNRAYIRVRRKGLDKKYQLIRIFNEIFPELIASEIIIETRKGPWTLSGETRRGKAQAAAPEKPKQKAAPKPQPVKEKKEPAPKKRPVADLEEEEEAEDVSQEPDDDLAVRETHDVRSCKVCNLKKRPQEFSPREDMCLDCYMGRDELLKEIIAKRRKAKEKQARFMREASEESDDKIDSLDNIDYDISLSD